MSHGSDRITITAVINPALYVVAFLGSHGNSLVGLYGIIPPEFKAELKVSTHCLVTILDLWRSYNTHLKEFISCADKVEFKQTCMVDGVPFGKFIIFESTGSELELKDYLLQTTIGVISDEPDTDALIIKDNSLKPIDFSSSLSSSDESTSPLIKGKRKTKGRGTCLKKPLPLSHGNALEKCISLARECTISDKDSAVVEFLTGKRSNDHILPSELIHRLTSTPKTDAYISKSSPTSANKSEVKVPPIKEEPLKFHSEQVEDFGRKRSEWIESLAAEHACIKTNKPTEDRNKVMYNTCETPPPQYSGRGRLIRAIASSQTQSMGRGKRLKTILEREHEEGGRPSSQLGHGQYLKTVGPLRVEGGRGHRVKSMLEQSGPEIVPPPGTLKRVFSLDMFGGFPRITKDEANESNSSEGGREPAVITDLSGSSTSTESLNQSTENQIKSNSSNTSIPEEQPPTDCETLLGSNSIMTINKLETFIPEEIPSDCPINEYLERIIAFEGLIHGKNSVPPKLNLNEMDLHPLIIENLKKKCVKDLARCQIYSIPAILKRRNFALIGPPRSGKTIAALIPLVSLLCDKNYYSKLPEGCGPLAVCITSCAQSVRSIAQYISLVCPHLYVISTYGGGLELERKEELANGCDILISTPNCWLRLLTYKWVTNVSRLCHLFIDDLDAAVNLFQPQLMEILKVFNCVNAKRGEGDPKPQIILVGESWTPLVNDIVLNRLYEPLLCMTSHLEAALYAQIRPEVHILIKDNKLNKLLELLEDKSKMPGIIVCRDSNEVKYLRSMLYVKRTNVIIAHGDMVMPMIRDAHVKWQNLTKSSFSPPLMVVSDNILNDLGINNAQWLLHYSLPFNKTDFSYRFSSVKSFFTDRLANPQSLVPDCKVDILVDDTNEEQLPEVVSFMSRLRAQIPPELLSAVEKINAEKEIQKSSEVGLCSSLVQFGSCWKESRCKQQHCINYARDKPRNLPLSGTVNVKILKVHSATHYSARLIAHTEESNITSDCWTELQSNYVALSMHMNRYYANRNNRRMHGSVKVGNLAAVEVDVDTIYRRVKVLQITSYDDRRNPKSLKVHHIDDGTISDIKAVELLHLPNELRTYPRVSVDMYLSNLLPVDLDRDWSFATTSFVKKKISSLSDDYTFIAKLNLVIGCILLVDDLKALQTLEITKCSVVNLSVKSCLLEHNLAVANPEHLRPLIKICQEAKLPVATNLPQEVIKNLSGKKLGGSHRKLAKKNKIFASEARWAHLPKDEASQVNVSFVESPSLFYVSNEKFNSLLKNLEKDIAEHMGNNTKHIQSSEMSPNLICLAKYEDRWNRGMFCDERLESSSDEAELSYLVHYVDYGDKTLLPISSIAPCPDKFISTLPFQAIKCQLVGLNPVDSEWSLEAGDSFFQMTETVDSEDCNFAKTLSLVVTGVVDDGTMVCGRHYKVILIDSMGSSAVVLNKELMCQGFANWNPHEKHLLDNVNLENFKLTSSNSDDTLTNMTRNEYVEEEIHSGCANTKIPQNSTKGEENAVADDMTDDQLMKMPDVTNDQLMEMLDMTYDQLIKKLQKCNFQIPLEGKTKALIFDSLRKDVLAGMGKMTETEPIDTLKKRPIKHSLTSVESENDADISEMEDTVGASVATITSVEYPVKSGFFTPRTGWLQDYSSVIVRIMIPDVNKYSLTWSSRHFDFSTSSEGKRYRLYIEYFGQVVPENFTHNPKGLYLEIKMQKVFTDFKWPQLLFDEREKPIWLQMLNEPECIEKEYSFENRCDSRVNRGETGYEYYKKKLLKIEENNLKNIDDDDSDGSEINLECHHTDPYDPFQ